MKRIISLLFAMGLAIAHASPTPVQKDTVTNNLTAGFNVGSGVTVTIASGGSLVVASGGSFTPGAGSIPWSAIGSTPTTLAGYGITDPIVLTSGSYSNPSWITLLSGAKISGSSLPLTAIANQAANTFLGNNTGGSAGPIALTAAQMKTALAYAFTDLTGTLQASQMGALTGDITSLGASFTTTLATVNGNVGSFGSATVAPILTVNAKGLVTGVTTATITPAASSLTGTLAAAQFPALTGPVTTTAGALATTLVNIPVTTVVAGSNGHTNVVAPSTPSAGTDNVWTDSTDLRLHDKNSAGIIGTTVVANAGGSHLFLTSVSANGVVASAQPAATDVSGLAASATTDTTNAANISSGTLLAARMPALTGDVTSTVNTVATTVVKINGTSLAGLATGILKNTTGTGVPSIAASGTDYAPATSGSAILKGNGAGGFSNAVSGTDYSPSGAINSLTGDVTASGPGTVAATVANIPATATVAGANIHTNVVAPSTPAAAHDTVWTDSTDLRLHDKNASGVIGTTVVADTGAANNYISAISAAGAITKSQPAFSNLSGSIASTQTAGLSGDVTSSAGTITTTVTKINGIALSGLATGLLKNTTGTGVPSIGVAATDYVAPSAYASANGLTMSTARLLGRSTAATGAAEEITVGSGLTLSAGSLTATGGGGTVTHTAGGLTTNALVVGNGSADINVLASLGTTTTVLHGNASGLPIFGAVALGTDVSGTLAAAQEPAHTGDVTNTAGSLALSLVSVGGAQLAGFRNHFINGDQAIDQANAGASVAQNGSAAGYGVDMWTSFGTASAGVFTQQQATASPPAGFTYYNHITTTTQDVTPAAGSAYQIRTCVEGYNCQDLQFGLAGAQTITVSFQARSSLTGSFSGSIRNGVANRAYPFSFTVTSANVWQAESVTIPGDTSGTWTKDNTTSLIMTFDLGSGSTFRGTAGSWSANAYTGVTGAVRVISTTSATFDFTGVQLERGSVATPFEYRPRGLELTMCQRYYAKSFDQTIAPAQNAGTGSGASEALAGVAGANGDYISVRLPVTMRSSPAITYYNPAAANTHARDFSASVDLSGESANRVSTGSFSTNLVGNAGTAAGDLIAINWTADARIP